MKKIVSLMLAAILTLCAVAAFAETGAIDAIMNAGTTQAFTDEAVADEDLTSILSAGLAAASAINQQPWYFAAVSNADVLAELGAGMSFGGPKGGAPADAPEGKPEGAPEGMPADMPAGAGGAKASVGDSPVAIIVYVNENTASPDAHFDCGLAVQNMYIAATALGYGVKIVSAPTMALNGEKHDDFCAQLGVDTSLNAVAVLLIGRADETVDATSSASVRSDLSEKVSFIK